MLITEREMYLNGTCHLFAMALHNLTKLEICAIVEDRVVTKNGELITADGLIHAFCIVEDFTIFDANGIRHIDQLNHEYHIHEQSRAVFFSNSIELLQFDICDGVITEEIQQAINDAEKYINDFFSEELKEIKNVERT